MCSKGNCDVTITVNTTQKDAPISFLKGAHNHEAYSKTSNLLLKYRGMLKENAVKYPKEKPFNLIKSTFSPQIVSKLSFGYLSSLRNLVYLSRRNNKIDSLGIHLRLLLF